MSKAQRDKGRRGQSAAEALLRDRDWTTDPLSAGMKREDIIATDPSGVIWSCEVKNCIAITAGHKKQAIEQARLRKLPWMLMSHIDGTSWWLIQRKGMDPVLWSEKGLRYLI